MEKLVRVHFSGGYGGLGDSVGDCELGMEAVPQLREPTVPFETLPCPPCRAGLGGKKVLQKSSGLMGGGGKNVLQKSSGLMGGGGKKVLQKSSGLMGGGGKKVLQKSSALMGGWGCLGSGDTEWKSFGCGNIGVCGYCSHECV